MRAKAHLDAFNKNDRLTDFISRSAKLFFVCLSVELQIIYTTDPNISFWI